MTQTINNEEFLTLEEAARYTGYSRDWFRQRIVPQYQLQIHRKGRTRRPMLFKKSDLEPLVQVQPVEPDQEDKKSGTP